LTICACGHCGLPASPGKQFRRGHNKRNRLSHEEILETRTTVVGGCWEISGHPTKGGYVPVSVAGKVRYAHVIAWESASGTPVPAGFIVCHVCDNPRCWRNDGLIGTYTVDGLEYPRFGHLWLGSQRANQMDMLAKGRGNKVSGKRHPFYGKPRPEHLKQYGDDHWSHRAPEKVARGERSGRRTHPEKYPKGDDHWTHKEPERAKANMAKARAVKHSDLL
jgi:hypothetical protein